MELKKVRIQGNDNILRYAIKNQADLIDDLELLDFITADTVVVVTLSDVNFYELCRLSHHYREKIRVIQEVRIGEIADDYFSKMFPGEFENTETGEKILTSSIVKESCDRFMDLVLQMEADEDIIPPWAGRLFIPMVYRRFVVSVPIKFFDFILALKGTKMCDVFKDENYQQNIDSILFTEDGISVVNNILLMFSRLITMETDSDRSSQFIKLFKFQSLGKNTSRKLYHFSPIGLSKFNGLRGFDQKVKFFNANPDKIQSEMLSIGSLTSPLKVDFAVQLPLHQLQLLERTFSAEEIGVDFLSKPLEIIKFGIRFEDFIIPQYDELVESEDKHIDDQLASISAYRERIKSASENTIAVSALLINCKMSSNAGTSNAAYYGPSGIVALSPSIATTKAVLTLDYSKQERYKTVSDELNKSMLDEMISTMTEIQRSFTQPVST